MLPGRATPLVLTTLLLAGCEGYVEKNKVEQSEISRLVVASNDQLQPQTALRMPEYPLTAQGAFPQKAAIWKDLLQIGKPDQYDSGDPPSWGKGFAVVVQVALKIASIQSIKEKQSMFVLDLFLRLRWGDDRLRYDPSKMGKLAMITLNDADENMDQGNGPIWRPDLVFKNVAHAKQGKLLGVHTDISPLGRVFWARHISATFVGHFDYHWFPFDNQKLEIHLTSYKYQNNLQKLEFIEDKPDASEIPVQISRNASHPMFYIRGLKFWFSTYEVTGTNGHVGVLTTAILLRRANNAIIVKFILPVFILVMGSTLGFHVDDEKPSAAARVGVGVLCMMTQLSYSTSLINSVPKIAYLTWLDIFSLVAFFFNCFALVEYGYVCHLNLNDAKEDADNADVKARLWVPILWTTFSMVMIFVGLMVWSSEPNLSWDE